MFSFISCFAVFLSLLSHNVQSFHFYLHLKNYVTDDHKFRMYTMRVQANVIFSSNRIYFHYMDSYIDRFDLEYRVL